MSVNELKIENACGQKMPTQDRSACGKKINEMVENGSVAIHSAMGWAESIKCV